MLCTWIVSCSLAKASEFTLVVQNKFGDVYVDLTTIKEKAYGVLEVIEVVDLASATKDGTKYFKSIHAVVEYVCKDRLTRKIKLTTYKENMLGGEIIGIKQYNEPFKKISESTAGDKVFKYVCKGAY